MNDDTITIENLIEQVRDLIKCKGRVCYDTPPYVKFYKDVTTDSFIRGERLNMQKTQIKREDLKKYYKDSLTKKDIVINKTEINIDLFPIVKLLQAVSTDKLVIGKQAL